MPGYSGTPLPQKLGIKPGSSLILINAPTDFEDELGELTSVTTASRLPRARTADVILLFCPNRKALEAGFQKAADALVPNGGLWISWPKKSSGVATDINENDVREHGLVCGLVDNKVCAITQTWSGLRFVHRVENRDKLGASQKAPRLALKSKLNRSPAAAPKPAAASKPARSATPRARRPSKPHRPDRS
ncbi:MAG: DUF3052 family protein [Phycisphaerales bacterium]|nr:DUF3052 family protein [Phycisphaerales bacterium]